MTAPAVDARYMIDGPAEIWVQDNVTSLTVNTGDPHTSTVVYVSDSPVTAGVRVGDLMQLFTSAVGRGTVSRVSAVTATTVTLETSLGGATPTTADELVRSGFLMGATQGGIEFRSKLNIATRQVDQVVDDVSAKATGRETRVRANLVEILGQNVRTAMALASDSISVSGTRTTISIGATSTNLPTNSILVVGQNENSETVTIFGPKGIQEGEAVIKFGKDGNAQLPLDFRLLHDDSQTAGQELATIDIDSAGANYNRIA